MRKVIERALRPFADFPNQISSLILPCPRCRFLPINSNCSSLGKLLCMIKQNDGLENRKKYSQVIRVTFVRLFILVV